MYLASYSVILMIGGFNIYVLACFFIEINIFELDLLIISLLYIHVICILHRSIVFAFELDAMLNIILNDSF